MVGAILGGFAILSAAINLWQWWAAGRFPLHRRHGRRDFVPGITLLKPLKGADDETRACLESWFAQDYTGPLQILFGVADANDPVCAIVEELRKKYATRDVDLLICNPILGANAKVSSLTYLEQKAKHDFWVISDADVLAPTDFLSEMIVGFEKTDVALVNCFYKYSEARTVAMIWEAIGINSDFWSQVCQSNSMQPMKFALGAVMAIRADRWKRLGGFKLLLNQLADDYHLGRLLAEASGRIEMSSIVVECREHARGFSAICAHQLRWARTIRVCQPGPYFLSILSNVQFWVIVYTLFARPSYSMYVIANTCAWIRVSTAIHNGYRLTRSWRRAFEAIFAMFKDFLQFFVWLNAFLGNTVIWRGEKFRVDRGGRLVKV